MVIVAGHITVEPRQRESYPAGCVSVVEQARGTAGCLDFAIPADLIDPGRVNIFERGSHKRPSTASAAAAPATSKGATEPRQEAPVPVNRPYGQDRTSASADDSHLPKTVVASPAPSASRGSARRSRDTPSGILGGRCRRRTLRRSIG